jgi:Aldo/keto reductase family
LPRFTPEALKANQALINLLGSIAQWKRATPAQIALAWLLAQKPWIVPIPGTTKLHRLEENIWESQSKSRQTILRDIDTAASKITVQGARYPEKLEKTDRPERLGFLIRKLIENFAIESDRQFVAKSTSPVYLVRRNRLQLYDSVSDTR